MPLHANYGGVVPELASREHLRNIVPVVREAAMAAKPAVTFADLDAIAVTEGPGLAGALLVGITYAKALAFGLGKPLIAVNHLEGHIHAVLMEARQRTEPTMELPLLALVVSGGHTHLYLARSSREAQSIWTYRNVGRTVDDAAGEAFDKVAKLLGLGYPGGPWIDALAPHGNPRAVPFTFAADQTTAHLAKAVTNKKAAAAPRPSLRLLLQRHQDRGPPLRRNPRMRRGIEARRASSRRRDPSAHARKLRSVAELCDQQTLDLIASFQYAVVGDLQRQTFAAAEALGARGILVSGGVAANSELRRRFQAEADRARPAHRLSHRSRSPPTTPP